MAITSSIEWTDATWNPVTGCTKVSPGCKHCYAEAIAQRFWKGRKFTDVRTHEDRLGAPLKWRKARRVFVNSMSDLFHEDVPDEFIRKAFGVMSCCGQHTFQILTKRAERMATWFADSSNSLSACQAEYVCDDAVVAGERTPTGRNRVRDLRAINGTSGKRVGEGNYWPLPNVWLGVSAEDQQRADERIPWLLKTPAAVRFVSAEPLLGPIVLDLLRLDVGNPACCECRHGHGFTRCPNTGRVATTCHKCDCRSFRRKPGSWNGIDWVIVGGESGPGARGCDVDWIRSIMNQCKAASVACFVKQVGTFPFERQGQCSRWPVGTGISFDEMRETLQVTYRLKDKKGGDPAEWPEDLRVRQFPSVSSVALCETSAGDSSHGGTEAQG